MKDFQPSLFETDIDKRISTFLKSITLGFNTADDIMPKQIIEKEIDHLSGAIAIIEEVCKSGKVKKPEILRILKDEPRVFDVLKLILALPNRIAFRNGLSLSSRRLEDEQQLKLFVDLTFDVGLWDLLDGSSRFETIIRLVLVNDYARRRPYRSRQKVESIVEEELHKAVTQVSSQSNDSYKLSNWRQFSKENPSIAELVQSSVGRRGIDYIISFKDVPVIALEFVFLTHVGGSQFRDLRNYYPNLQEELNAFSIELILIADGAGFSNISREVLYDLFRAIRSILTIKQITGGELAKAITQATTNAISVETPLDQIISSTLNANDIVTIDDLPVPANQARIALARFINDKSDLDLKLAPGGDYLSWTKRELISRTRNLVTKFQSYEAIKIFRAFLNGAVKEPDNFEPFDSSEIAIFTTIPNAILPSSFLVVSTDAEPSANLFQQIASKSHQTVPDAKLAILVTPHEVASSENFDRRAIQSILPANVITVDSKFLSGATRSKDSPRSLFTSLILQQSDLTKISPFVVQGATPRRMYFGREREEAILLSTLTTNSVAILGSRRVGKTSLMHHVTESLKNAGFSAFFGDFEAARNWEDFCNLAQKFWRVELPHPFEPQHLFLLIEQLATQVNQKVVLLLDEIDQLLDWDMRHQKDQVPEAFFRTCRTISQGDLAQFVFSGERTIARKLWDPQSPHWNFCRAVALQQLDRESTGKLIIEPLTSLQVVIEDHTTFQKLIWRFTSGHPQIAQYLGDRLVRNINKRSPESRGSIAVSDLEEIANTYDFKEHYLTTYWGQATVLEKLISLLVFQGIGTLPDIILRLREKNSFTETSDPEQAAIDTLRMLEFYGIIRQDDNSFRIRLEWFGEALAAFGNIEDQIARCWGKI